MSKVGNALQFQFVGGKKVVKTLTAVAGDVATNLSPGEHKRWKLLYGSISLVADATVGNRYIGATVTDSAGNILINFGNSGVIVATQTRDLAFIPYGSLSGATSAYFNIFYGLGEIIIDGTDRFTIAISGGIATDEYSARLVFLEVAY